MARQFIRYFAYAALALGVLAGMAYVNSQGVRPIWVVLGVMMLPCLLVALVEFPAIFVVPLLFISRKMFPPVNPYHNLFDITALPLGILLVGLAMFFRIFRYWSRRDSPPLDYLFKNQGKGIAAYFLFAAVVTASYLWTRAPDYGAAKLISFLTAGTVIFLAPFLLMTEDRDFRHFALFSVGFALVIGMSRVAASEQAVYGAHEDPTHIGIAQLLGMAILLVLFFGFFEKRWAQNLLILALPVLAAELLASESRGALFSLLVVLLCMLFMGRRQVSLISPRTVLLGVGVIFILLLVFPEHWFKGRAADKFRFKTQEMVDIVRGKSTDQGSGGRRLVFYRAALQGFGERPVAGWGVGGWATYYWHNDDWEYPHNMFMEVGVEEGLLGLVPLLALLFLALKAAKKAFDEASGRFAFVLPLLLYSVLTTLTSGDIDDCRYVWFWCAMAFVACRIIASQQHEAALPAGSRPVIS